MQFSTTMNLNLKNSKSFFDITVFLCSVVLFLSCLNSPSQAQQQPPTNQQNLCSSRFEAALAPTCFESYGVNFTGVIHVLSGNRSGAIPAGYDFRSFLDFMCSVSMQDNIIPCVLQQMQKYNNTQCTEQDRLGVLGRGGQLLAFMDAVCGEPCEQEATQSLIQCYAAINVNPEPILQQNASIADDKYTIVGSNETEYDNFCNNRVTLFSCLSPLSSSCPGLIDRLYTIGFDLEAMEIATGILCEDKKKFFDGLTCITSPSAGITQCRQTTQANMQQVLVGRYQSGSIPPSQYMEKLCEAKLTQVDCELQSYEQSCSADISSLKTSVECAILPKPCKDNDKFMPMYNSICKKATTPTPISTVRPTVPSGGVQPPGNNGGVGSSSSNNNGDNGGAMIASSLVALVFSVIVHFY